MNTQQVADRLVAMCREGENMQAVEELYADNCISREISGAPNELTEGKDAIRKKSEQWYASVEEFHGGGVCTFKERGRMQMEEVCVFEVQDGKIVAEQFFYNM